MIRRKSKGFTLIELSIVIVIIGLIVAGVIGGQQMVHQAKLRNVLTDYDKYILAVNTFKLHYNAIPGDMANAKSYWSSCTDVSGNNCNGNGDGVVEYLGGNVESIRVFQHLYLANMVPELYTGVKSSSVGGMGIWGGVNIPNGPFSGTVFAMWGNNQIFYASVRTTTDANEGKPYDAALSTQDAYNIDRKVDDGLRDSGEIWAYSGTDSSGCESGSNYALSNTGIRCRLQHRAFYK